MTDQTTMKTSVFENTPCIRCDGTGYIRGYSHVMHGVCFSCGGRGYHLTKRGAAAREHFDAAIARRADELVAGEIVWYDRFCANGSASQWVRAKVVSIEPDELNVGRLRIELYRRSAGKGTDYDLPCVTYGCFPDTTFKSADPAITGPARDAAIAYQATLTKAGTVRKRI